MKSFNYANGKNVRNWRLDLGVFSATGCSTTIGSSQSHALNLARNDPLRRIRKGDAHGNAWICRKNSFSQSDNKKNRFDWFSQIRNVRRRSRYCRGNLLGPLRGAGRMGPAGCIRSKKYGRPDERSAGRLGTLLCRENERFRRRNTLTKYPEGRNSRVNPVFHQVPTGGIFWEWPDRYHRHPALSLESYTRNENRDRPNRLQGVLVFKRTLLSTSLGIGSHYGPVLSSARALRRRSSQSSRRDGWFRIPTSSSRR